MILLPICLLIGVVLGLRFKVLILVPTIGLALSMIALNGTADGIWRLVGTMILVATFLQLGYVGGSFLRLATFAKRDAEDHGRGSLLPSTEVSPSSQVRNHTGASSRFERSKQLRQA